MGRISPLALLGAALLVASCDAALHPKTWIASIRAVGRTKKMEPPVVTEEQSLWPVRALLASMLAASAMVLVELARRRATCVRDASCAPVVGSAARATPAPDHRQSDSVHAIAPTPPATPKDEKRFVSSIEVPKTTTSAPPSSVDPDSPVICTGGVEGEGGSEDSRTDSSEKSVVGGFDAEQLEQLAGQLAGAHPALREKAVAWVSTLARGIAGHIEATEFSEGCLTVRLRTPLSGEIATRSRVPVSFELESTVRVSAEVDKSKSAVLNLQGILLAPIEGASDVYKRLLPEWKGCKTAEAKAERAWEFWLAHKHEFEGTKLWRLIESLAGLRTATLIPRKGFMDIIMGCICVTRSRATSLRYSFYGETTSTQVRCTTTHDQSIQDSSSKNYDPDAEWKSNTARDIALRNVTDSVNRELAEKFAKSGINFSLLFSDVEERGIKGASPDVVAKLFQQSLAVGGATHLDRMVGAMKWQRDDPTFKATGDHGRVLWKEAKA